MGLKKRVESRNFTDMRLVKLLRRLSSSDSKFWKSVAKQLSRPRNERAEVNLGKLDRVAEKGLTLVVPGKVLGSGRATGKLRVAAYKFSNTAVEGIEEAGGEVLLLDNFFDSNPKGEKAKVVV